MKITISTGRKVAPKTTINDVVDKLNSMVKTDGFFLPDRSDRISFGANSNTDLHTKLICIVGMFLNSKHNKHCSFLSLGYDGTVGRFNFADMPLGDFMKFLDSIGDVRNVQIEIN